MLIRLATVLLVGFSVLVGGCASTPETEESVAQQSDVKSDPKILYAAIHDVYDDRDLAVAIDSEEKLLLISEWSKLNSELRRRFVSRVVPFARGIALNVTAEYERRDRRGEQPRWVPAEDVYTLRRAKNDEEKLGNAIRRRFRAMKDE